MKNIRSCPVCNSLQVNFYFNGYDILYRTVPKKFLIYQCRNCQAVFISPIPKKAEIQKFYPKNYYSYNTMRKAGFFTKLRENIIRATMEPELRLNLFDQLLAWIFKRKFSGLPTDGRKPGVFLDIGCGDGRNLAIIKKYGWKVFGIELDKKAVEYAKSKGLNVQNISLEKVDFGKRRFDCIRVWHVFEHLPDPHLALSKIVDMLKQNGEIFIAVPNTQSFARMVFRQYWYGLDAPRHLINYSPKTLEYLFKKYFLIIEEIKYASCGSFLGSLSNLLRYKFGYKGNLIHNLILVFLFSPLDFVSDLLKVGDTIFLKVKIK